MLEIDAIYRFTRTDALRYYRAAQTRSGVFFLYPISVAGSRIADKHPHTGRPYVLLYFLTQWGKFAVAGYWMEPKQLFEKAYVTDATPADLELVTRDLADLPDADLALDNILNRQEIELDMDVWGELLAE